LHRVKNRNILHTVNRRKGNCIGLILLRDCLVEHVIERKIEGRSGGRQGGRLKQLLDNVKERREFWKLSGSTKS